MKQIFKPIVLVFYFFTSLLFAAANQQTNIQLTNEELSWLKQHPNITLAADENWKPFDFKNTQDVHSGFNAEYLKLLAKKIGIDIKVQTGPWSVMQEKVKRKELSGLIGPSKNKSRSEYLAFTEPYFTLSQLVLVRNDAKTINSLEELNNRTLAVKKGSSEFEFIKTKYPKIKIVLYDNNAQIVRAVSMKEVVSGVVNIGAAIYETQRNFIENVRIAFEIKELAGDMRFAIRKDWTPFVSILDKAIKAISQEEFDVLLEKWLQLTQTNKKELIFSTEELAYLKQKLQIKVGGQSDWLPFDFVDKSNKYQGISKDILELVASKTGLNFHYITGETWAELLQSMQSGDIDILPAVYKSKKREEYINFTKPYFKIKDYIFMRSDDTPIKYLSELTQKRVAVIKGYQIIELLKQEYPNIEFVEVKNLSEGIDAVLVNKADVYIDGFAVVSYYLSKNILSGIKPVLPVDLYMNELYIGVNKNQKILSSIVNKALKSITLEEKNKISSKWFGLTQQEITRAIDDNFSDEEKKWLKKNPTIRLAYMNYWPKDSKKRNIHTEYAKLLQQYGNVDISLIRFDTWNEGYKRASSGNYIHGIMNLSWSEKREKENFDYTPAYNFSPSYLIVKQNNNTITQLKDLENKTIYLNKNSIAAQEIKALKYTIKPIALDDDEATHQALSLDDNKAEAILTYTYDQEMIKKYNLKVVKKIYNTSGEVHIGTSKNHKQLQSIVSKIFERIPKEKLSEIKNKDYKKSEQVTVNLTEKEKLFLEENQKIKVHNETKWAPFNFFEFGQPSGYSIDLIKLVAKKTGLQIEFITGPSWNQFLEMSKKDEIDIMLNIVKTVDREQYLNFTDPYYVAKQGIFVRKDDNSIKTFEDILKNKKIAVVKGFYQHDYFKDNYPKIKLYPSKNEEEVFKSIINKKADLTVGVIDTLKYTAVKNYIKDIKSIGGLEHDVFKDVPLSVAVRKNAPELFSIVQKGLAAITTKERWELHDKWLNSDDKNQKIQLTNEELNWIKNHKTIKFTGDPNWLPYEAFQKNGDYIGVVADHLKLIEQRLGITIEKVEPNSWSEAVVMAKNKEIDVISGAVLDTNPLYDMKYTKAYLKSPLVVVMQKSDTKIFVADLEQLKDKKIGYVKDYAYALELKKQYPHREFYEVESIKEGLEQTASGKLDAFVCTLAIGSYNISKLGLSNLDIVGRLSVMLELGFGIRQDWEILVNLFNKAIDSISEEERSEITNRWIKVNVENTIDYTLVWKISAGVTFLLIFITYWNRKLKQIVNKKTKELEILLVKFDKNVITSEQDEHGIITSVSDALSQITGYKKEELIGKHFSIFFPKDISDDELKNIYKKIVKGKDIIFHKTEESKKDGTVFYVKTYITPKLDQNGNFIGWSSIREDITAQIEVEKLSANLEQKVEERTQELNLAKDKFESMVSNVPGAIYRVIDNDLWPILYCSDELEKITGYPADDFMSGKITSFSTIMYPDDIEPIAKEIQDQFAKGKSFQVDYRVISKSGEIVWVRSQGQSIKCEMGIAYIDGVLIDITEAKKAEKMLEDQKKYTDSIMNAQNNMVISTDGLKIISANKAFFDFFDVDNEIEFEEKYGECVCDTFDTNAPQEYLQKVVNGEKWIDYICNRPNQIHKVLIQKENINYTFSISADKFTFKGEELKTAVFTDITELEAIRQNIEMILSNIMLPVLITSKKTRTILYANEYASKQYEISIDELIGMSIDNVYTNVNQKDKIRELIQQNGCVENLEEVYRTNSGKEFIALLSVNEVVYQNEKAYIGMVVDITKQKAIEDEIRLIHKHTRDSIEYASLIQEAIVPNNRIFSKYFQDFFTIWHPKDVVGGDVYLFEELRNNNECLLMVIDCTGHGVPGAFVTMLVKAIEREIIARITANDTLKVSPAWILSYFNKTMKKLLKQEEESSISNAGFDGGVIYYNKAEKVIKYAGANTPLFYFDKENQLNIIKGSRHSVGYKKSDPNFEFKEYSIAIEESMQFYITTDGYFDQNGGTKGFPLGKKQFARILDKNHNLELDTQKELLLEELKDYQKDEERNDDVTVIGFKI